MEMHEALFVFSVLMAILISLIKFYNVLSLGSKKKNKTIDDTTGGNEPLFPYDMRISFVLLVAYALMYLIGFTMLLLNVDILTYSILFRIESYLLLPLNILFFIVELLVSIRAQGIGTIEAYKSKERPGKIKLFG